MTGRTTYTADMDREICARLAEGRSLRSVCRDADMPHISTIYKWLDEQPGFSERYARACNDRAHALAEEALEIADDSSGDVITDENGVKRLDAEFVQRSRLRVDTRKWFAARLNPKVYGDRQTLAGDPENPLAMQAVDRPPTETREQWMARRATELAAASRGLGRPAGSAD